MKRAITRLFAFVLSVFLITVSLVSPAAALKLPEPKGYVNDYAGLLSDETAKSLEGKLRTFESESGNEIAVVMVEDLQGTTVEDFAVRLFEKWKIGKDKKDNGVLLLVAKQERKVRIEVGYGLEPTLTDAGTSSIIRDVISPAFKQGNYDRGVTEGVDAMISAASGEGSPATGTTKPKSRSKGLGSLLFPAMFIGFAVLQWFGSVLGRTKSWWMGGVIGAVIGLAAMIFSPVLGLIAMALLTPLGLLLDFVISKSYADNMSRSHNSAVAGGSKKGVDNASSIPWWAGGFWGPGGGFGGGSDSGDSGGGFGGFGGGDSGGGGASGDW